MKRLCAVIYGVLLLLGGAQAAPGIRQDTGAMDVATFYQRLRIEALQSREPLYSTYGLEGAMTPIYADEWWAHPYMVHGALLPTDRGNPYV